MPIIATKVIDAEIRRRLEEEKALERRAEILTSIPGISDVTGEEG
ncbi:MAG: hypothetical protein OXE73_02545 [Gammaproteobacteria bacterium]|nr:hypothetical protein [Gammaproteobacteria bacterium]